MKRKLIILGVIVFSVLLFSECKKDEPEPEQQQQNQPVKVIPDTYAKKWEISNKAGIIFQWLEFTEYGIYFLSFDDGTYLSGLCTYDASANQIILVGYGYVEIISLNGNVLSIKVYVNETEEVVELVTTGSDELPASANTDLLCKTWDISEYKMTNQSTGEITVLYPTTDYNVSRYDAVFTSYGTYFTTMIYTNNGQPGQMYDNRYWRWGNASETEICYGISQPMADDCTYSTSVSTLNDNTVVFINETGNGGDVYTIYIKCTLAN